MSKSTGVYRITLSGNQLSQLKSILNYIISINDNPPDNLYQLIREVDYAKEVQA